MSLQIREIKVVDLVTYAVLPPIIAVLMWTLGVNLIYIINWQPWLFYLAYALISYILLRRFAIGVVLIYKASAPLSVRSQCRFVPTCSTYMIMAIKKYGLIIGIIKGIKRLLRCKPPNGGEDYP